MILDIATMGDYLHQLETALETRELDACNMTRSGSGFQVSVRRKGSEGWSVFFGDRLADTLIRAIENGPQRPEGDDMTLDEAMKDHPGWPVAPEPTVGKSATAELVYQTGWWNTGFDTTGIEPSVNHVDPNGDDTAD